MMWQFRSVQKICLQRGVHKKIHGGEGGSAR